MSIGIFSFWLAFAPGAEPAPTLDLVAEEPMGISASDHQAMVDQLVAELEASGHVVRPTEANRPPGRDPVRPRLEMQALRVGRRTTLTFQLQAIDGTELARGDVVAQPGEALLPAKVRSQLEALAPKPTPEVVPSVAPAAAGAETTPTARVDAPIEPRSEAPSQGEPPGEDVEGGQPAPAAARPETSTGSSESDVNESGVLAWLVPGFIGGAGVGIATLSTLVAAGGGLGVAYASTVLLDPSALRKDDTRNLGFVALGVAGFGGVGLVVGLFVIVGGVVAFVVGLE